MQTLCFVFLFKFSYWSKFHVNIIIGSEIMTIFFYKGLTGNPEIGNTHVWVFPNIWRLGRVMDTKFDMNVSNRMLLNAAKFQGYNFYHFWVIKGKPTGGKITSPLQIRVNKHLRKICNFCFLILPSKTLRSIIRGLYFQNLQHDATIKLRIYLLLSLISKERKKIW